jgi:hypothetical protein
MIQEIQQNTGVVLRQVGLQVPIERSEIGSLTGSRCVLLHRRAWQTGSHGESRKEDRRS